MKWRGMY